MRPRFNTFLHGISGASGTVLCDVGEAEEACAGVADKEIADAGNFLTQRELRNGTNRARTCDLLRVKQALFQLSYDPPQEPV